MQNDCLIVAQQFPQTSPAILGIPNLMPTAILLTFNESVNEEKVTLSLILSSSISDCALYDSAHKRIAQEISVVYLRDDYVIQFVFSLISV